MYEVKSANMSLRNDCLVVDFADKHRVVLRRNLGGWGDDTAIDYFRLESDGEEVARYNSPYQYPRNTPHPDGFVGVTPSYTLETIVGYWQAAQDYVFGRPGSDSHTLLAKAVAANAAKDLDDVKSGRWVLPSQPTRGG